MRKTSNRFFVFMTAVFILSAVLIFSACEQSSRSGLRFTFSFSETVSENPITGRIFLAFSPDGDQEPRIASYNSSRRRDGRVPFFATDVDGLTPGKTAVLDASSAVGCPLDNIGDLSEGDYFVQAVFNVYTEFNRSDGHAIWAHMDQWEGQRWAFSPGNLISKPMKVHLDPNRNQTVHFDLTEVIPPIDVPENTKWVKRVKIQSKMLTEFWGHPIFFGATVLLPRGYEENSDMHYPVIYIQNHFSLDTPWGFDTTPPDPEAKDLFQDMRQRAGGRRETGYEFFQSWISDDFPRMIAVTFQHPTPFFDDSYAVNSANNGPYGDAILIELIPYLEESFRMIPESYARVLTGGSTGGWESLALQVFHPEFFGGTWTFYPDPVDFRRNLLINIYEDENAFIVPDSPPGAPERMFQRTPDGQPVATVRQISQMEAASGNRGRSGAQIDIWNAVYGPVGEDGYPRRLWDLNTGVIDREVAYYMRDNGYDLRYYLEKNWAEIGPQLVGKIRIYNPEMDSFYLPYAVYLLEEFLESTTAPYYGGEVIHGRPMKGHGWQPMTYAELAKMMAAHIAGNVPRGADTSWRGR